MYTIHQNEISPPSAAFLFLSDAIQHIEQPRFNRYPNSLIKSLNGDTIYTRKDKFFSAYHLFVDKLTITL